MLRLYSVMMRLESLSTAMGRMPMAPRRLITGMETPRMFATPLMLWWAPGILLRRGSFTTSRTLKTLIAKSCWEPRRNISSSRRFSPTSWVR
ncbi:hypothetical protein D3C81_2044580 [compost metagenome]